MRHRIWMAAALVAGLGSACTFTTNELEEALDLPKVTPEVQASFQSAISTVTEQVLDAAFDSIADVTTPTAAPALSKQAFRKLATAQAGQSVTINNTVTKEDGGTITVTGTITGSGTDASGSMTFDLKAEWTNLGVSDGTTTQKSTGSETITGTMTWTGLDTDAGAIDVDLTLKGSFTLGTENYTFNIVMALEGENLVYSGSVNGQNVTGSFASRDSSDVGSGQGCLVVAQSESCEGPAGGPMTCQTYTSEFCVEFTDASWTEASMSSFCAQGGTAVDACTSAARLGRCAMVLDGRAIVQHRYDAYFTQTDCESQGGTWQAN